MPRLYGRADLFEAVVPSLVGIRPDGRGRIHPPRRSHPRLVVCGGGRGTGKSAVLAALSEQYAQRIPQAHADLAASDFGQPGLAALAQDRTANASRTSDLLFYLNDRLSRKPAHFDRQMSFPRLTQGLLAVSSWEAGGGEDAGQAVRPAELTAATRRLAELLRASQPDQQARKDKAAAWVKEVVQAAVPLTGLPSAVGEMVQALLRIVAAELFSARAHQGGLAWWAARHVTNQGGAHDQLTELALRFRGDAEDRRLAERHLIAALLADIAEHYGFLRTANGVPRPLLLLDNVHSPLGQVFLDELVRAWHEETGPRRKMRPAVIATALEEAPASGGIIPAARRGTDSLWRENRPDTASQWTVGLPLTRLDSDDVKAMFGRDHPPLGTARLILRLSGGRAGIAHALVGAVTPRVRLRDDSSLATLLDLPAPAHPGHTVTTALLEWLAPDAVSRDRLVYFAPALDDTAAHRLSAYYPPRDPGGVPVQETSAHLRENQWSRLPWPGIDGPFVGNPVLRRLLLHELRSRTGRVARAEPWKNIHLQLRALYAPDDRGGTAGPPDSRYLHHSLALGERDLVVRALHQRFTEQDAPAWLTAVNLVCAAPHPPPTLPAAPPGSAPCPGCASAQDPVHQAVGLLVNQLWQLSRPLAIPEAATIDSIGLQLLTLAQHSGPLAQQILYRAHREWPQELHDWAQAPSLPTYGESGS
ncbi:hypothetical protein [Streptomyces sp. ISL-11]|uniref:hypothetical protein n=1 Tax=Streptomyces sp. ISL-11 TaxID=2819174 RepID=UPI001BEBDFF9|nr:hypothetical protein [Streptomyces sp. ISL-11]MBT2383289.1 hypothetical protein [Streptomyces sp. ISL-11]